MSDIRHYRIVPNQRAPFKFFGCLGCLITIFVIGGILGLLWQGWSFILGL